MMQYLEFMMPSPYHHRSLRLLLFVVGTLFLLVSFWRTPLPASNEPNYLGKAKHYWNPDWCSQDLLYQSGNAHLVFYQTFGWLTTFLSLDQTAFVGRMISLSLLAIGWTSLIIQIVRCHTISTEHRRSQFDEPTRDQVKWLLIAITLLWLFLMVWGSFSGEWIIGGVEGKVISYACLFWSWSHVVRANPLRSGLLMGIAISFHPVVGMWGLLFTLFSLGWSLLFPKTLEVLLQTESPGKWSIGLLLCMVTALPGLIPVIQMLSSSTPMQARLANEIQVFDRIRFHLDPNTFSAWRYLCYGLMTLFSVFAYRSLPKSRTLQFFSRIWIGCLIVAGLGLWSGLGLEQGKETPLYAYRVRFLKIYPFRLADSIVPIGTSVLCCLQFQRFRALKIGRTSRIGPNLQSRVNLFFFSNRMIGLLLLMLLTGTFLAPSEDRHPGYLDEKTDTDWKNVCHWIRSHSEPDALILTPLMNFGFKWYADRAEYVSFKDCPQDDQSLLEWKRRIDWLKRWKVRAMHDGMDREDLLELQQETQIELWLVRREANNKLSPLFQDLLVFQNETHSVFKMPTENETLAEN